MNTLNEQYTAQFPQPGCNLCSLFCMAKSGVRRWKASTEFKNRPREGNSKRGEPPVTSSLLQPRWAGLTRTSRVSGLCRAARAPVPSGPPGQAGPVPSRSPAPGWAGPGPANRPTHTPIPGSDVQPRARPGELGDADFSLAWVQSRIARKTRPSHQEPGPGQHPLPQRPVRTRGPRQPRPVARRPPSPAPDPPQGSRRADRRCRGGALRGARSSAASPAPRLVGSRPGWREIRAAAAPARCETSAPGPGPRSAGAALGPSVRPLQVAAGLAGPCVTPTHRTALKAKTCLNTSRPLHGNQSSSTLNMWVPRKIMPVCDRHGTSSFLAIQHLKTASKPLNKQSVQNLGEK